MSVGPVQNSSSETNMRNDFDRVLKQIETIINGASTQRASEEKERKTREVQANET